jgi:acetyl-CoA carboxylase biotin carboxylase subunit
MAKIQKLLVANRGEISLRIMRSAKEAGIKTVAIFSDADRNAPHVRFADEAAYIGKSPSRDSYLNMDKILEVASLFSVDAIHPGYGFLSENAEFARRVNENGICFVGPSPASIAIMGSKLAAKKAVGDYDIPLVPGTAEAVEEVHKAKIIAAEIGYPVLIKASAGGGGKGMRIVYGKDELEEQMNRAIGEASSAFGDPSVFIEKYIESPKHIEIQVLGDQHGNIVHLFERECSIQRRHQKVVEEAPSSVLDQATREKMGEAAVNVARACNYHGAGTVEFVVDQSLNFYFLEMNTRLQVEHPVTEMITGIDLVKEQLKIAEGRPLAFRQNDLQIHGHALEIRVYAEDPENGFLPDTGKLAAYSLPQGPGVRVDDGYEEGMEVPIHYDPMLSKLIVHGSDRNAAIEKMKRAITDYRISGVKTTLPFCAFVMTHPSFIDGSFTTKFVEEYFQSHLMHPPFSPEEKNLLAAFGAHVKHASGNSGNYNGNVSQNNISTPISSWKKNRKHG